VSDEEDAALADGAGLFGPAPEDKASLTKYHAKLRQYRKRRKLPATAQPWRNVICL